MEAMPEQYGVYPTTQWFVVQFPDKLLYPPNFLSSEPSGVPTYKCLEYV